MPKYLVEMPVVMRLVVEIEADNEQDAIEKTFDEEGITIKVEVDEESTTEILDYEWEMHEKVVQGNVYYGGINEPYAEKMED
jgi:hypothetical protein